MHFFDPCRRELITKADRSPLILISMNPYRGRRGFRGSRAAGGWQGDGHDRQFDNQRVILSGPSSWWTTQRFQSISTTPVNCG